jgi:hypothetical protein
LKTINSTNLLLWLNLDPAVSRTESFRLAFRLRG